MNDQKRQTDEGGAKKWSGADPLEERAIQSVEAATWAPGHFASVLKLGRAPVSMPAGFGVKHASPIQLEIVPQLAELQLLPLHSIPIGPPHRNRGTHTQAAPHQTTSALNGQVYGPSEQVWSGARQWIGMPRQRDGSPHRGGGAGVSG